MSVITLGIINLFLGTLFIATGNRFGVVQFGIAAFCFGLALVTGG
jgi:hypothetical protein